MHETSMLSELKTLFWLQWKLTLAMFRGRRMADRAQIVRLLLAIVQIVFTFPMFLAMGVGLAVGLILLSPRAAFEVVMLLNTFLLFIWLLLPSSSNSQIVERFEMARLFPHPISFRGIVVGSTLISLLSMTGIWTIPMLLGEVVGLAWHAPLALPLIVVGALPVFALLVLAGRIMDDFFDLVASDRRLRALVLFLLSLPFIVLWLGQYYVQYVTHDFEQIPEYLNLPIFAELEKANGVSEFLEILQLSRLLIWLPAGWTTAGMGLAATGAWGKGLLFLALSLVAVAGLLRVHAGITRRLMAGAALTIGVERVRTRGLGLALPGPTGFWALFRKDWLHLRRSPMPRRLAFSSLVMTVAMIFSFARIPTSEFPKIAHDALPLVAGGALMVFSGMAINIGLTGNYFGTIDREGFGTLAQSAVDRRTVLLSSNLVALIFAVLQYAIPSVAIAVVMKAWWTLPLLLYMGLCLQLSSLPVYTLAAIIGPYRTQLKYTSGSRGGNLWGMLAWLIGTPPVLALILLPYFLWKPALIVTVPLCAIYSVGLYVLTLKPLAGLLQRREHAILEAVTSD
jgi:hypothetical protein